MKPMREGKVAIITGGSRGIGAAAAAAFARDGYRVVIASRHFDDATRGVCEATGAKHVIADVARESDVEHLFASAIETFGSVDVVAHCAAVSHGSLLVSLDDETLDEVLAANLTGSFLVGRAAARVASANMPVTIIWLGSLAQHGSPANASYALTKGGLLGLSRVLSRAPHVRSHLLSVGYVETELTHDLPERTRKLLIDTCPLKRSSTPDEVAQLVVAIADSSPALATDRPIYVSGGLMDFPT